MVVPGINIDEFAESLNDKADRDLQNLDSTGSNEFANPDLSNLTTTGNSKFITTDTTQTVAGEKTFQDNARNIFSKSTTITDNATTPSTTVQIGGIYGRANDNSLIGAAYIEADSQGNNKAALFARRKVNGSEVTSYLTTGVTSTGDKYATAPTPTDTTSTSSSQIATVGFVNTLVGDIETLLASI